MTEPATTTTTSILQNAQEAEAAVHRAAAKVDELDARVRAELDEEKAVAKKPLAKATSKKGKARPRPATEKKSKIPAGGNVKANPIPVPKNGAEQGVARRVAKTPPPRHACHTGVEW